MPRYEFTTGQVLTADEMNDLSDQTVMTFAGTAARGSAIPTPVEGMLTYIEDADELQLYDGSVWGGVGGGKILQVVQTVKTDTFSTTSTSYADITGLTATITPSSVSSKILILAQPTTSFVNQECFIRLSGGNSTNYVGDSAGSRTRVTASPHIAGGGRANAQTLVYVDSPATTSAVTYGVQAQVVSGGTFYLNRGTTDADNSGNVRAASSITVMELAG